MSGRYEIRLAGSGGQGLVLAGVILAEAAALYDGKNAVQSQSYGPESRGGASKSEVVISDSEIDYPKTTHIDLLLLFTEQAAEKYLKECPETALVVADSDLVPKEIPAKFRSVKAPITRIAREQVGKEFVANIVAVGLLRELTGVVTEDALIRAVLARVPKGTEEMNKKALALGKQAAQDYGAHILKS